MNLYFLGILAALVVFFAVGIGAGRMVKDTNDYYVSGRNAPTLLIVGSLIASFLSTGAFLGDTGEVYSGFFIGIVTVGVIQATGYIYGAGFFGRYIRRSEVTTLPEYFGRRFCSARLRRLSAVILLVSVSAYLLSAIQGVSTLMSSITGYDYRLCAVIVWLAFTAFTIYSGSPGVLLTDTIMFLVFLAAALVAVPFLVRAGIAPAAQRRRERKQRERRQMPRPKERKAVSRSDRLDRIPKMLHASEPPCHRLRPAYHTAGKMPLKSFLRFSNVCAQAQHLAVPAAAVHAVFDHALAEHEYLVKACRRQVGPRVGTVLADVFGREE